MSTLDEMIQAARGLVGEQTNSDTLSYNQELERSLASLDTEQAEIKPAYDIAGRDLKEAFGTATNTARESAASRGVYRSGILSNQELKLGTKYTQQVGDLAGERARKLTDIAKRRSMAKTQTAASIGQKSRLNQASLVDTIAKVRDTFAVRDEEKRRWETGFNENKRQFDLEFGLKKTLASSSGSGSRGSNPGGKPGKPGNPNNNQGYKPPTINSMAEMINELRASGKVGDSGYGSIAEYLRQKGVDITRGTTADKALRKAYGFDYTSE